MSKIDIQPVSARAHHWRYAVPVFEDELVYRDQHGNLHPWTLGLWSGYYRAWSAKGVEHNYFEEARGAWEFIRLRTPREERTIRGKRKRVATVVLYPEPIDIPPDRLEYGKEIGFALALELMQEIRQVRLLRVVGIPMQVGDEEYGFAIQENETIPPGITILKDEPKVWIDHSPKVGKPGPEVETNNRPMARQMAALLPILERMPDLPMRIDRLETMLQEVLEWVRDQRRKRS